VAKKKSNQEQASADLRAQDELRRHGEIPRHIAIIMDGNGRWAKSQGKIRYTGHSEGVVSVRDITEACAELGVEYLTLYTFSTENWHRPLMEVNALMQLLIRTLQREKKTLIKNRIRLRAMGDLSMLPEACRRELDDAMEETSANHRMTLNLALSYSGRWELVEAARALARKVASGKLSAGDIDEAAIAENLCTVGMPDPDLLIRTGGEYRVSNFLLWQIAYSELYITEIFWPAFRRQQLYEAIFDYQERDRRFGRVNEVEEV